MGGIADVSEQRSVSTFGVKQSYKSTILELLDCEKGDKSFLRKVGKYQSKARNIPKDFHFQHRCANSAKFTLLNYHKKNYQWNRAQLNAIFFSVNLQQKCLEILCNKKQTITKFLSWKHRFRTKSVKRIFQPIKKQWPFNSPSDYVNVILAKWHHSFLI